MQKVIGFFSSVLIIFLSALCFAQSNQTESLTISTFYPSPYGVYRNLQFNPSEIPTSAAGLSEGVMYYDKDSHLLRYYNNTNQWVNLTGGGGSWWEGLGNNIHNINPGKVIFNGVPNWNGELMWIKGNLSLASPTGNNTCYLLRSGEPSDDTCRSAFSFVSSGFTEYTIQHWDKPPHLILWRGPYNGSTPYSGNPAINQYAPALIVEGVNVGVTAMDPLVPLHVETSTKNGTLILRSAMGSPDQSGIASLVTYKNRVYLAYACYLQDSWKPDPYNYGGVANKYSAKFTIWPEQFGGAAWYAADDGTCSWDVTGGHEVYLWNPSGTWTSENGVKLPAVVGPGPDPCPLTPCNAGSLEYYNDNFCGCTSTGWKKLHP